MKAYTEETIPKYEGPMPFIAFYPDDLEMVEDAKRIFDERVTKGMQPVVIARTGKWRPISNFSQAYGSIQKRIYFP